MSLQAQRHGHIYEVGDEADQKEEWSESAVSLAPKEEPEPYDPYILPRSRAANAHNGNAPSIRSPAFAPRRPSVELGNVGPPELSLSSGELPYSGQARRIRGGRSPLGREPLTRQPTLQKEEREQTSQQDEPLMRPHPQRQGPIMDRPRRHHSPPPASYRPPRQDEPLIGEASSARSSVSGDGSETDSQGKRRRAKLQKQKRQR